MKLEQIGRSDRNIKLTNYFEPTHPNRKDKNDHDILSGLLHPNALSIHMNSVVELDQNAVSFW